MTAPASHPSPRDGSGPERATAAIPAPGASPAGGGPAPLPTGQRPPAPPPPPAWASAPPAAAPVGPEQVGPERREATDTRAARRHARHRLGGDPPARIALANHQPVFVTLNDISSGGCCVVRKGRLELSSGDAVIVDLWTESMETKLSIHARVCWCSHQEASSRAGLRFVETNHRLLRQIEAYVQHVHRPVDASRPQARLTDQAQGAADEPPPNLASSSGATASSSATGSSRPRRGSRSGPRSPERRELATMPRPGRLTSLDLQRRMRPAHRHEVARIAEETGIHIHTLYGWLRTLRLEGEIHSERPRDPEAWSATDKFSALLQVAGMGASERATWCSRHGIGEEHLQRWRQAALQANEKPLLILRAEEELQRLRVRDQREIRRLQKELRRRERSAAIGDELLQVVRKLQILWEQGETPGAA